MTSRTLGKLAIIVAASLALAPNSLKATLGSVSYAITPGGAKGFRVLKT